MGALPAHVLVLRAMASHVSVIVCVGVERLTHHLRVLMMLLAGR